MLFAEDLLLFRENNKVGPHCVLRGYRTAESVKWIRKFGRNLRDP